MELKQSPSQQPMALGKYEVVCQLSTGGMSEIFLAYQRGIGGFRKVVVLKTILPDTRGHEEIVRMFLNEARVTAEFSHPNIVQVYDLGIDNDMLFLAMEYIQGCNVVEMVRACHAVQQTIPMGFTLAFVRDTALALSYAHGFVDMRHRKRPIVHRDVAGKNIMVTYDGTTKLLDFGIAKMQGSSSLTFAGTVKGTTGYMSPEQLLGLPLDGRSDIFSLGIVVHECLTGYRLFHESSPEKKPDNKSDNKKMAVLNNDILPPSSINPNIPSALDAVILKALKRDPNERFQSALEFARALEDAAGDHLWRAEQVGALVSQHFSQRREQTRKLIEEVQTRLNDFTGKIQIADFLGQIQTDEMPLLEISSLEKKPEEASPSSQEKDAACTSSPEENLAGEMAITSPEEKILPGETAHALAEEENFSPGEENMASSNPIAPPSLPPSRSALIPIELSSPREAPSSSSQDDAHATAFFHRLLTNRYVVLASLSLLLGVALAVLLFWIFTGFSPTR